MTETSLTKTRLHAGTWQGLLTHPGEAPPRLRAVLNGAELTAPLVLPGNADGEWQVSVPVPPEALSDGMQVILILDAGTGAVLNSFAILAGEILRDEMLAEVELLRAELDLLKRAFRRHCVETAAR